MLSRGINDCFLHKKEPLPPGARGAPTRGMWYPFCSLKENFVQNSPSVPNPLGPAVGSCSRCPSLVSVAPLFSTFSACGATKVVTE